MLGVVGLQGDDTPETANPLNMIILDLHEDGGESFCHGGDVGVHWLVLKGDEFFASLLECERYLFWCLHFSAWTVGGGYFLEIKLPIYKEEHHGKGVK